MLAGFLEDLFQEHLHGFPGTLVGQLVVPEHHDVVFSGNIPWIGVYTSANGEMIPLRYRAESLLKVINEMHDVDLYDELEH
mgnify:CR=1 FL=1